MDEKFNEFKPFADAEQQRIEEMRKTPFKGEIQMIKPADVADLTDDLLIMLSLAVKLLSSSEIWRAAEEELKRRGLPW
jgi:hypothetical protein